MKENTARLIDNILKTAREKGADISLQTAQFNEGEVVVFKYGTDKKPQAMIVRPSGSLANVSIKHVELYRSDVVNQVNQ